MVFRAPSGNRSFFGTTGHTRMRRLELIGDWGVRAREAHYQARELAIICFVSESYLRRFFHERTLHGPQEWMNELRLWDAMRLLCRGARTKEVAAELGFSESSHFCREFRKYHGCSPTECVALFHLRHGHVDPEDAESFTAPWKRAEIALIRRLMLGIPKAAQQTDCAFIIPFEIADRELPLRKLGR